MPRPAYMSSALLFTFRPCRPRFDVLVFEYLSPLFYDLGVPIQRRIKTMTDEAVVNGSVEEHGCSPALSMSDGTCWQDISQGLYRSKPLLNFGGLSHHDSRLPVSSSAPLRLDKDFSTHTPGLTRDPYFVALTDWILSSLSPLPLAFLATHTRRRKSVTTDPVARYVERGGVSVHSFKSEAVMHRFGTVCIPTHARPYGCS